MREILFRGKTQETGKWVYGFYHHRDYEFNRESIRKHYILPINAQDACVIDPETVGQFTGLTDKNGNRIFEGDILQGDHYPYSYDGENNYFAEVVWFEDCPAFGLYTFKNPKSNVRGISHGISDFMNSFNSSVWEVIGNIFDNPELLMEDEHAEECAAD